MALQTRLKGRGVGSDMIHEGLMRRTIDQEQFRIFDGVDEILRRCAGRQARAISNPPCLRCELDDVLLSVWIDDVVAEAASRNECCVSCDIPGLLEELPRGKPSE